MRKVFCLVWMLVRLDELGIDVWKSRGRWFWARREDLKAYSPAWLDISSNPVSPVTGPFKSAYEAGANAINAFRTR